MSCGNCENVLNENFEYCPYCGEPLTKKSKELEDIKTINAQLILLASLIKEIEDTKSLYVLEKYVKKLNKR